MVGCPEQVLEVMTHLTAMQGYTVTPLPQTLWRRLCGLHGWQLVIPHSPTERRP
jgi:hypothetical protein